MNTFCYYLLRPADCTANISLSSHFKILNPEKVCSINITYQVFMTILNNGVEIKIIHIINAESIIIGC